MKMFRMLGRNIRDAGRSVKRNFSLSLAAITCITITLVIVAIALLASLNVNNFTTLIKKDVTIVAFVDRSVDEAGNSRILSDLQKISNIANIEYKPKLELSKEMQDSSSMLAAVMQDWSEEENPLKDTYQVKVDDIEQIGTTAKQIENIEGISSVNYGEGVINQFLSAFRIVEKGTVIAVVLLVIVTVFLIVNTIKLTIFSRKREISIMRLVGASNLSIKIPFVIEGMLLGFIGAIIPVLIIIYGYYAVYQHFDGQIFSPFIRLITPEPFVYWISLLVIGIGMVVGVIGSYQAVRRYLKI